MKNLIELSGALVLLAGIVACEPAADGLTAPDRTAPTAASVEATQAQSGLAVVRRASVDRFPQPEFLLHLDAERGLMSAHMPSDFCLGGAVGTLEVLEIETSSEIEQRIAQTKGESVPVAVYEADSFADAGISGAFGTAGFGNVLSGDVGQFCSFLLGPDRIAEGTVRRQSNLSNASFSVRWTGQLEATGGGTLGLTEVYQLTADAQEPADATQWSVNTSKILLH